MTASSPIRPLTRTLALFRALGGFPLVADDDQGMRWRLNKVAWSFSLIWMTAILALYL